MRLLFVLENYYPNVGGVETLFKSLIKKLSDEGHQITLITTKLSKASPEYEKIDNIEIYRYPYKNRYYFTFFAFLPVLKHAKNADIIHTTSYNAGLPAIIGGLLKRKKVIITFHEVWGKIWWRLPYMKLSTKIPHYLFEQMLLKLPFTKFIAVSEATAFHLKKNGVAENKIKTIYNGVDYEDVESYHHIEKTDHKNFIVTYYGRVGISKGLDLIVRAAAILQHQLPNSYFKLIIPTHPKNIFNQITDEIDRYGLDDYIVVMNHLKKDDLIYQLRTSDCVMIPSYSEGFCFAAAESIGLGLPIISSNKAALKEVVSGKHIKMESLDTDGLVNAVLKAARGEWEETPIKRFSVQDCHQQYINLYEELMNNK